jgi:DNA adenine methylase
MTAPIVKWVGGKTRLLPELLARMPAQFNRYYEPFVGGAALFFAVAPERSILGDANEDLINVYRAVADEAEGVIAHLEAHNRCHSETHYYATRERWNDRQITRTRAGRAGDFVYLNKTCFNGIWRVNRAGAFNVPMGNYANPPILDADALRAAAGVLRRADLRHSHYRDTVRDAGAGDFVYFDPPYDPVSATASFTSYTAGSFGLDDQRELADLARELVARGCSVLLSNSDTPFIRSLYLGCRIDTVRCSRAINSNVSKRGDVDELVIVAHSVPATRTKQGDMNMSSAAANAIAAIDLIDYARPHREETRDLPCKLSPGEYREAGVAYAKAVRDREAIEREAGQSANAYKAKIETAKADERRRLKILETQSEERPTAIKELWAKKGGEDVLVAVRLDLFTGYVDDFCYVGDRHAQPLDRQGKFAAGTSKKSAAPAATGPSEENLQRQADAALASAEASTGEPQPFEDDAEDGRDRTLIPFPGAAAPETAESETKPAKAPKGKSKR